MVPFTDIPLPRDLAAALEEAGLTNFFSECTVAHKREYLKWISEAKRAHTREVRIAGTVTMLAVKRAEEERRGRKGKRGR